MTLELVSLALLAATGFAGGLINAADGSGTLIVSWHCWQTMRVPEDQRF